MRGAHREVRALDRAQRSALPRCAPAGARPLTQLRL